MKALFAYDYGETNMNKIRNLGYETVLVHEKTVSVSEQTEDAEVLVCYNPFTTLDISQMKKLRWIQLTSIGIDQAPIENIKEQGIVLTNNKGGYSIPMGEWIVLKILEMFKNSKELYERQENKQWHMDTTVLELYGKTIGFIGTGSIAHEAAQRLQGFGVTILGINTNGALKKYYDDCYSVEQIDQMISKCDVVVVTIPYTEKTHHLIDGSTMEKMKENSYLVNVSRGNIIDEKALINLLKERKIKGAALDVFEKEPLDSASPLWDLDNVVISSHNSWISEMRNERRFQLIYDNLKRYIHKEDLLNIVNLTKGY